MNRIRMRVFLLLTLLCSITFLSVAQTGSITGTVKDSSTKQAILGATIRIVGTQQGVSTNQNGNFEIAQIEPGNYALEVSFLSYQNLIIQDIKVEADKALQLNLEMTPSAGEEIQQVVISANRLRNSNQAVLTEIRGAKQVVSGISQQQIRLSQDRDAAQVMSRIPGLTIVDNRFVIVRGIPERYNQVMLNNSIAPSTEIDKRTFSFDLIPSGVLERMMIYKSGSPENPGDFAGGLVKLYTNSATGENFTSFTVGSNFRAGTTLEPYMYNRQSSTEFLGFDNGDRKLPSSFPANIRALGNGDPLRVEAPKTLDNDFSNHTKTAIPDLNFGFSLGRKWDLNNNRRLSMLTAVNYAQSYQFYTRSFNRYERQAPEDYGKDAPARYRFMDDRYEKENRVGLLTNWALVLNPYHKIEFKNLLNQIGENINIERNGRDFVQQSSQDRRNYMYEYRARTIYTGQFEGTHRFEGGRSNLNWVLGSNIVKETQPDLRRFRTTQEAAGSSVFRMELPPSSNLFDTGRYFGDLSEIGFNQSTSIERRINDDTDNPILIKAGYLVDYRTRDFKSRYFSYKSGPNAQSDMTNNLQVLPLDQIFANQNFATDRFVIEEGTNPIDSYKGNNLLSGAFIGATLPFGKWNLSGGIRGEYNVLKLNSHDAGGNPVNVNNKIFSPLGFLNADYALTDQQKIRFGYGRTVNRPEFREVAPFLYYDFELDANRNGNPDLKTAYIDNVDLRYEWYPRTGETISVGGFYKRFKNPIETVVILQSESQAFSLTNADGAYSYGAEIEVRKSFKDLTSSAFIDKLNINLNGSIIKSEVDYGNNVNANVQDVKRPLQGQSPYIANAILNYVDEAKGWNISAAYNTIGARIYAIGNTDFPTVYELPRHSLDLTVSKNLNKSLALKVGVQDLLNSPYRFYQDTNRDRKIDNKYDDVIFQYKRGTLFTTSLTYTIK